MVWHRNEGQNEDDVLQNKFTAYLLSAVKRRRALYIETAMHDVKINEAIEGTVADDAFEYDMDYYMDAPVYMKIQNEKLYQALFELSERERYVFFNRVLEEKSMDELAAELGLSYKGVAAVYYRTVQRIRNKMRGGKVE
ncbi:MAG: sigma-70 family RNA polymerase sigma factor [Oscillospiraceae bacterium]|nr:sigma-70 family RNA polymerase sigma factor [Oscillospiraceae bacterium]